MIIKIIATIATFAIDFGLATGIGNMTRGSVIAFIVLTVLILMGIWA